LKIPKKLFLKVSLAAGGIYTMMRIITGRARGTHLYTLEGDATRPTSERAKEAVFSILQFELAGRAVLDLFAGSGQMGLEAVSRGAERAVLVDASPKAVEIIKKNVQKTRFESECTVLCADYADVLRTRRAGLPEQFGLVIIDPPYAKRLVPTALNLLLQGNRLEEGAFVVCESAEEDIFEGNEALAARFEVRRRAKYGVAYVTVLRYGKEEQDEQ
jgi:16S rRNA (guanine(966)-N(2))-methyltransferase RsmD